MQKLLKWTAMEQAWRERLELAAKKDGRKLRTISLAAGLPPASLWEMLNTDKQPGVERVKAICDALNISIGYVFEGIDISPEGVRLLKAWAQLPKERRENLLEFLDPHQKLK